MNISELIQYADEIADDAPVNTVTDEADLLRGVLFALLAVAKMMIEERSRFDEATGVQETR